MTPSMHSDGTQAGIGRPHPDVVVPDLSLTAYLFENLGTAADRLALVDGTRRLTFGELRSRVDAFATGLAERVRPGEVVALLASNSTEFVVAFLGALRAGVVVTPVNVLATAEEVSRQATGAGARLLLAASGLTQVAGAAARLAGLESDAVLVLEDELVRCAGLPPYAGEPVPSPGTHLAVLPYSSGTTGQHKGVMLTHRSLVANVAQIEGLLAVGPESVLLAVLPFSHIYGMTVVLHLALRRRAALVVMPRFELGTALDLVEAHRITHLFVAPRSYVAYPAQSGVNVFTPTSTASTLGKSPEVDGRDLSSVRVVLSGAAPLDDALASSVAARLDCDVRQAYGMSEMSPVSHIAPVAAHLPASSVGWTVPNMRIRLVDIETGEEIGTPAEGVSRPGELCCAGPNLIAGYLNDEAATRASVDELGYLHTGDVATVSADGVVTIVDRFKELIKYKGYQVAPAELEGVLLTHPDIVDAAVIGIPRGDFGDEWPMAYVVRVDGSTLTEECVMAYIAARVAPDATRARCGWSSSSIRSPSRPAGKSSAVSCAAVTDPGRLPPSANRPTRERAPKCQPWKPTQRPSRSTCPMMLFSPGTARRRTGSSGTPAPPYRSR